MRCKYPDCHRNAAITWALVPLCRMHKSVIEAETARYYANERSVRIKYEERTEYLKIAHLIPWSQVSMGKVIEE